MFNFDISNERYSDVESLTMLLEEEAKEKQRKAEADKKAQDEKKMELQQKAAERQLKSKLKKRG